MAMSGGFYFCVFANDVECLDVSDFMVHRAALPSYIENDPEEFTDDLKAQLNKINGSLRQGMEAKISADIFKAVTGVSYDDLFSLDSRIDVNISAAQAKQMGLVSKVNPLTSSKKSEIMSLSAQCGVAAFSDNKGFIIPTIFKAVDKIEPITIKTNKMTVAELKTAHPEAYAAAVAEGVAAEKSRVETWMVYNDVDAKAVAEGIESGKTLSPKAAAEFGKKMFAKQTAATIESEAPEAVKTAPVAAAPTAEAVALDKFNAEVKSNLSKISIL
jgi:hypothetical protein